MAFVSKGCNGKGKTLPLFTDNIIIYIKESNIINKKATRTFEFNKIAGYMINIEKSVVLFYT